MASRRVSVCVAAEKNPALDIVVGRLTDALTTMGCRVCLESGLGSSESDLVIKITNTKSGPDESFSIRKSKNNGRTIIELAGADVTGLIFGLFEYISQLELSASNDTGIAETMGKTTRSPRTAVRSVCMFLHNQDLEKEWFFADDFWQDYFRLLAKSRFNCFSLVFGFQTAYLSPPFPFLLSVPGYEHVRAPSCTENDRERNLNALKTIVALAKNWGMRFVLGIWQQHAHVYGENLVRGLSYEDLFDYCPKGLSILLSECPEIDGVQFRMNEESGIAEKDQLRFFKRIFQSIRRCGRHLWVDLRAKGLRQETIDEAVAQGLQVTVSTKYWCEHMGLPFFSTQVRSEDLERYRRYGYWDLLHKKRNYQVLYRLWSLGSQKILLWGDEEYTRRFAETSRLGESIGFEVCAPLSNKGYGNRAGGAWRIMKDRSLEYYRWEFERYWAFYMCFGLQGYAPGGDQTILRAEFVKRFGRQAACHVQEAYSFVSRIVPLVTAFHAPSASTFGYWPEMDTGGLTDAYARIQPMEAGRFYGIREYIEAYLSGEVSGKLPPIKVAERLRELAEATETTIQEADVHVNYADNKEYASTKNDFLALAELALYHAAKIHSCEHLEFFRESGERARLLQATKFAEKALSHWKRLAALTDVYYDRVVFNRRPEQVGHWKDEIPLLDHDVKRLEDADELFLMYCEEPGAIEDSPATMPWYELAMEWKEEDGEVSRWVASQEREAQPLESQLCEGKVRRSVLQSPYVLVSEVFKKIGTPAIAHVPIRFANPRAQIQVAASFIGNRHNTKLMLYYKRDDTDKDFQCIKMTEQTPNDYCACIEAHEDGQGIDYYIAAQQSDGTHFHGAEAEPHTIIVRDPEDKPCVMHTDVQHCYTREDLPIEVTVKAHCKLEQVKLHYRHVVQNEQWQQVFMEHQDGNRFRTFIPGNFVTSDWDIMYAIEAVDDRGRATFYPDMDRTQPYVVVIVKERDLQGDKSCL